MTANAKDLITSARAVQAISSYDFAADSTIQALITAASDAIEKYCRRRFVSTSRDELYSGNGDRRLLLREYPIQSVQSVRYRPTTVLKVQNTDTATNQQARVAVTSTGLTLTRVASGVVTTDTSITWATYVTVRAVRAAIILLGNGWTADVTGDLLGDYGQWPSVDLYVPPSYGDGVQSQGALTARGQWAEIKMHTYELAGYQWDPRGWLLRAIPYTDPELLHPEDLVWPTGINNFRIQYTAGYTTVPEAVQEACARWVAILYQLTRRDPLLTQQSVPGSVSQMWQPEPITHAPPAQVAALLAPYRRHTVATNQG